MNDDQALRDFVAKYARPYDPESDDYDRPPFAADIKEGKNDPIYNAHSYHTKVPPRGIIPYILHYPKPGYIILDPFFGSAVAGPPSVDVATRIESAPSTDRMPTPLCDEERTWELLTKAIVEALLGCLGHELPRG